MHQSSHTITASSDMNKNRHDPFVASLKSAQPDSLTQLYEDHEQMVSRVIQRILGPSVEIEDLVQETFLHAFKGIARFRGEREQLGGWLKQIAIKRTQKHLRYQRIRRSLRLTRTGELPEIPDDQQQEIELAMRRAYAILDGLSVEDRTAFTLRFFAQMTIPEIVGAMNSSRSTVKRRIDRSKAAFMDRAREDSVLSGWIQGGGDSDET